MLNRNHAQPDESATAEVIDLFCRNRNQLGRRIDELNAALRAQEAQTTLAEVRPIRGRRR